MANNKEMKTLGGYEIVDEKAREDINIVAKKTDEALSLAKGATRAFVYDSYNDMISELNTLDKSTLSINYHVMIRTMCVPDLWVSGVSDEHVEYIYTSNEDFIVDLTEDGIVQVGYFILSALETQKVELDDYVKNDDYATSTKAGVVKTNYAWGVNASADGGLSICKALDSEIDGKTNTTKPIVPNNLDYAVMKALSDSKLEWTEEQKQFARALLGSVGTSDYASKDVAGVMKADLKKGISVDEIGCAVIYQASKYDIDKKSNVYNPITPFRLDYAVKKALSDCKLTGDDAWTNEEKAKALELLGVILSVGATKDTVVLRDGDGRIYTQTPKFDSHAATKKYVDEGFVTKDSKVETWLAGNSTLYATKYDSNGNPTQSVEYVTSTPTSGRIPRWYGDGRIRTNAPQEELDATNKKYVDDLVTSAKDSIALKDASTGQVYNVRINNGTLEMVLVDEEVE
jgi:hypothetical protein